MANIVKIEHGYRKGLKVGNGFCFVGSRITTSANRCVLFNILQNRLYVNIQGTHCADFCCGSGIVGFELLSFGANNCVFVDNDRNKLNNIKSSLHKLAFDGECVYAYLPSFFENKSFDIIFFDPPYVNDFAQKTLNMIYDNDLLRDNGILIFETKNEDFDFSNFKILHKKDLKNNAKFFFLAKN